MRRTLACGLASALACALATGCADPAAEHEMVEVHALEGPPGTVQQALVPARSLWRYHARGVDLGTGWQTGTLTPDWSEGRGPLGYGEPYLQTEVSYGGDPDDKFPTTYVRRDFPVDDLAGVQKLYLRVMFDDGFVFYLNGKEGGRAYMPSGTVSYGTLALGHEAGNAYRTYDVSSQIPRLRAGQNTLAIEVHQVARSSSDLVIDAELIAFVEPTEPDVEATARGIPWGSTWRYDDGGADLGAGWRAPDHDDSGWAAGAAPLGYGEPHIATPTSPGHVTTYFRHRFRSNGHATGLSLEARHDDGFVAYLNGVEVLRAGMPGGAITAATLARSHEDEGPVRYLLGAHADLIVEGVNTLAVEVHQNAASSSDLVWDARLVVEDAWQPLDSGSDAELHAVVHLGDGIVWAAGAGGTLLQTRDLGETWAPVATGTAADLYALAIEHDEADGEYRGVAVGTGGTVVTVHERDGAWAATSIDPALDLRAVSCPRLEHCVAVGHPQPGATADLYVTTDEGVTWSARPTGVPGGSWTAVVFADAMNGWIAGTSDDALGGTIYRTHDGGLTWALEWSFASHGYFPAALARTFGGDVWMVGQFSLSGHGELEVVSRGGGPTWQEQSDPDGVGLYGLDFVGDQGLAVGLHGSIRKTTDGGATWTTSQVADPAAHATLYAVDHGHGDVAFAVGAGGTILRTLTGGDGRGWLARRVAGFHEELSDVAFLDDDHGWVVGDHLYETRDGGDTWTRHPQPVSGTTLEVLDEQRLWIAGSASGQIWRSVDGGVTFTAHPLPDLVAITDLSFASPTHGWATVRNTGGDAPADLYRTTDGGVTWWRAPTGLGGDLRAVHFVDAQRGWLGGETAGFAPGESATVLRTVDGGATWSLAWVSATRSDLVNGLDLAGGTIVAVGSDGRGELIASSRDGGATWTERSRFEAPALVDVAMVDPSHGWAVGGDLTILATVDGGQTWRSQRGPAPFLEHWTAVDAVDRDHAWIVSLNGLVLETHTGGE